MWRIHELIDWLEVVIHVKTEKVVRESKTCAKKIAKIGENTIGKLFERYKRFFLSAIRPWCSVSHAMNMLNWKQNPQKNIVRKNRAKNERTTMIPWNCAWVYTSVNIYEHHCISPNGMVLDSYNPSELIILLHVIRFHLSFFAPHAYFPTCKKATRKKKWEKVPRPMIYINCKMKPEIKKISTIKIKLYTWVESNMWNIVQQFIAHIFARNNFWRCDCLLLFVSLSFLCILIMYLTCREIFSSMFLSFFFRSCIFVLFFCSFKFGNRQHWKF